MTYWPLAELLCDPSFLEDLEAADDAYSDYQGSGAHTQFKSDLKPSSIINLYSQIDTETLRAKAELVRPGGDGIDGPYVNISEVRGYESLLDTAWKGSDADAFADYIEGEGELNSYYADIRLQAEDTYNAFIALTDKLDAACEDLYDFCQQNVVGFADKYGTWQNLGRAAGAAGASVLAGAISGGAWGNRVGGTYGGVIGAAAGAIGAFIVTFAYEIIKIEGEIEQARSDLMQALNPREYTGVGRELMPNGSEAVPY